MYMKHQDNKNDDWKNKIRGIYIPTKMAGPSIQGIVEIQMEIMEAGNGSLCTYICSLNCALTLECTRLK